jgi:DNA-binding transcriptional LysR family regulator
MTTVSRPSRSELRVGDLDGLELFLDTLQLGSISAAARHHHLAQPSASERIHALERRLGVVLLRRGPGGSAPTPAGEAVAGWAADVLGAVDRMAAGVAAIRGPATRHPLRVAASLTIAEYVLPGWLHEHRRRGGDPVELAVANSVAVARAVMDGTAVVGFVESPRTFVGLRSTIVGGDRLAVVVAPTHPWARRRRPLDAAALASSALLCREAGSGTREALAEALGAAGHVPAEPVAVLASTTAIKLAVTNGDGAAVLSELAVAADVAAGTLVEVSVTGLDLRREFRAVWQPTTSDPAVHRFVRLARADAPSRAVPRSSP